MDENKLKKANKLQEEIKELDNFLFVAEMVWSGKVTIKDRIMKFVSSNYGVYDSKEYKMDTAMKNRVLEVLKDRKKELEKEFEEM